MKGTVRVDLHVHTTASPDSQLSVDEAVARAKVLGLQGIAITDHNSIANLEDPTQVVERSGIAVIPGVEVSASEGHVLAYFVPRVPPRDQPLESTIREIRALGGLVVLPHPYRLFHGAARNGLSTAEPLDAVEVQNGHTSASRNAMARRLASDHQLRMFGSSDAHSAKDLGCYFTELTWSEAGWKETLRRGKAVPMGPGLSRGSVSRVGLANAQRRIRRGLRPV